MSPPKKKGSSKKPAKARTPTLINGLTKEELSKEQLEEYIVRLREELDREREERNYFQLERDMIHSFWQVTDRKLAEVKAKLKNLEKEIEDNEAHHQVEIKVYKQKMKHLLFEHQNTICELEADGVVSAEAVQKDQERLEKELHEEMRELLIDTQHLQDETLVKELKMKHNEDVTATKNEWEEYFAEFDAETKKKMLLMQQEQENTRRMMISDRERLWNTHVTDLKEDIRDTVAEAGPDALREKKIDITETLTSIDEHIKLQECKKMELNTILQDNKRLAEFVSNEESQQFADVQKRINYYSQKTDTIENTKIKKLNALKRDLEALEVKFNKLQLDKDEMKKTFDQNTQATQQEAAAESRRLEREVRALADRVEETQAQLSSVLSASNTDHTALRMITNKVLENFDSANAAIRN
ncbi:dynein regulatory complex subunit 4 [Salarias fasciatus]|uniref:dynein regulatory complex subunit 4 n=1 Tax=Salarias fasciatus TaxID=181472 RepID=UPI001176AA18|nr:dynein regulatory complex subunit 4-like [Salarias fasciatus]